MFKFVKIKFKKYFTPKIDFFPRICNYARPNTGSVIYSVMIVEDVLQSATHVWTPMI